MYNIEIYQDKLGNSEINDYLQELSKKYTTSKDSRIKYNKIISYIRLLKQYGTRLGEPYMKYLEEDIWELRPVRDRILFSYYKDNTFILLTVFMKDTQKTPQREIEKAKLYLKDFISRSDENENKTFEKLE